MPYIDHEIILEAKKMDLLTYLENYDPHELVHVSGDVYCTKTHDSLRISNGKWCWYSRDIGGRSALDYLIKVKGYSFLDAVEHIMGRAATAPPVSLPAQKEKEKQLALPPAYKNADTVIRYLKARGIEESIIRFCLETARLYESAPYHNLVFVGFDRDGHKRYGMLRGTNDSRFMGDADGSDKHFSFAIPAREQSGSVHLFEDGVDLLSYASLCLLDGTDWQAENLLSLSGVYRPKKSIEESRLPIALSQYLADYPHIERIVLHLDNDAPGRMAADALKAIIPNSYAVENAPPSAGKDMNDLLKLRKGIPLKVRQRER